MTKKGQVSIFIIVALVVALIAGILYLNPQNLSNTAFEDLSFNKKAEVINSNINECYHQLYVEAIEQVGLQGGYFLEPLSPYIKNDLDSVPFYYFGILEYIPDSDLIEEQLAIKIESEMSRCFEFIDSTTLDYDYTYNLTKVEILDKEIRFTNNLQLTLSEETSTTNIDFSSPKKTIKSNLKTINNLASYIAFSYSINEESICISCIQEIATDENLIVEIDDDLENILIVNIIETQENFLPRYYTFALSATKDFEENNLLISTEDEPVNLDSELNFNTNNFNA